MSYRFTDTSTGYKKILQNCQKLASCCFLWIKDKHISTLEKTLMTFGWKVISTTTDVKCHVAALKSYLVLHLIIGIFFGIFGSLSQRIQFWRESKAYNSGSECVQCCISHHCLWTDTIKLSLLFSAFVCFQSRQRTLVSEFVSSSAHLSLGLNVGDRFSIGMPLFFFCSCLLFVLIRPLRWG